MNYSSALVRRRPDAADWPQAQQRQDAARARASAGVQPGHRVLEIGCGWGALAEMARADFGASVTGVTLSTEQLACARAPAAPGLATSADLRLQDYRDIADARFDAIVSIEMFEAVGREYWPALLPHACAQLLKPGGRACIQTITIRDDLFERYVRGTDFIQQYIFPGGLLPSPRGLPRGGRRGRPGGGRRAGLRPRLRRDAAPLARAPSCAESRRAPAGLRRALPAHLGASTSPTAKRPSTPATPTSCSSRCSGR